MDEYAHFDYVAKIAANGEIPPRSDYLGEIHLLEYRCNLPPDIEAVDERFACGVSLNDREIAPFNNYSSATGYAPPYYVVTGVLTRVVDAVSGDISWVESARIASVFWLRPVCRRSLWLLADALADLLPLSLLRLSSPALHRWSSSRELR